MSWDALFSIGVNSIYFIVLINIDKFLIRIGGTGDANMIWIVIIFLTVIQTTLSFTMLSVYELITKKNNIIFKTVIYILSNSFLPVLLSYLAFNPALKHNPFVHLNLAIAITFIWIYNWNLKRIKKK